MLKNFFIFSCAIVSQLFASTIPDYEIATASNGIATLTNGARFQGISHAALEINSWRSGDEIQLIPAKNDLPGNCFFNGHQNVCPQVNLKNITRNKTCLTKCIGGATPGGDGVFTISSINTNQRLITLDDNSEWLYEASGSNYITLWHIGDQLLIGSDPAPSKFDGFFFNTTEYNTLLVQEQP